MKQYLFIPFTNTTNYFEDGYQKPVTEGSLNNQVFTCVQTAIGKPCALWEASEDKDVCQKLLKSTSGGVLSWYIKQLQENYRVPKSAAETVYPSIQTTFPHKNVYG